MQTAPSAFSVESFTHRSVTVTWTDADDAVFYRLYFGTTPNFSEAVLFCPIMQGVQRAIIGALTENTNYWLWIVAENASGELSTETVITCTTQANPGDDVNILRLQDAIYEWAVDNFGDYAVIWERQGGTKPGKPFVTLNLINAVTFGGYDHLRNGNQVCGNRKITVSVNVYSNDNSWQQAMDLRASLERPEIIDYFQENGAGITDIGSVTDISQLLENIWESRVQFDFSLIVASTKPYDAGQISEVEYESQIEQ